MKGYRVIWHSLLMDGQVTFCVTFKRRWTARLFCWWMNRSASRTNGSKGERIRWFAVEKV
jgi:hypothetical protein